MSALGLERPQFEPGAGDLARLEHLEEAGGRDCDDDDPDVHPDAAERLNDLDDDCDGRVDDGVVDLDGDGYTVADGDCDDLVGWRNPGLDETCDYIDNDCDGLVDEDCVAPTADVEPEETPTGSCAALPRRAPAPGALAALLLGLAVVGRLQRVITGAARSVAATSITAGWRPASVITWT